jgi:hypothetical protein
MNEDLTIMAKERVCGYRGPGWPRKPIGRCSLYLLRQNRVLRRENKGTTGRSGTAPEPKTVAWNPRSSVSTKGGMCRARAIRKKKKKTYNTGDSLVVTHPTTNPALLSLYMGERTGSLVF